MEAGVRTLERVLSTDSASPYPFELVQSLFEDTNTDILGYIPRISAHILAVMDTGANSAGRKRHIY